MISSDFRAEARKKLEGKWGKVALITLAYFVTFFIVVLIKKILFHFFDPYTFKTITMFGLYIIFATFNSIARIDSVLSIIITIIGVPLSFGLTFSLFKFFNAEDVKIFDFLKLGFNNFKRSWGITFQIIKKMILPLTLLLVSFILFVYAFSSFFWSFTVSMITLFWAPFSYIRSILPILMPFEVSLYVMPLSFIAFIISMIWTITKSFYYKLAYLIAVDNPDMTSKNAVLKSEELMTGNRSKLFWLQLSFIGWAILSAFTFGIGMLWLAPYMQFAIIAFYKYISGNNQNIEAKVVTDDTDNPIQ